MTSEGPEYWQFYASYQQKECFDKIRALHPGVSMSDEDFLLTDARTGAKVYNPNNFFNVWSTTGTIIHLMQPNNTLSAEIDIAAQGTVIRKRKGSTDLITNQDELIMCSKYGNPGRNSDPHIGASINGLARAGNMVTVVDPIALYIHEFDTSSFVYDLKSTSGKPKKEHLQEIKDKDKVFVVQRGDLSKKLGLRIRVAVPDGVKGIDGQQLNVSNIYDTNTKQHIRYGAQFADYILIGVTAVTKPATPATAVDCYKEQATAETAELMSYKVAATGAVPVSRR
jgi:hypothetical protein